MPAKSQFDLSGYTVYVLVPFCRRSIGSLDPAISSPPSTPIVTTVVSTVANGADVSVTEEKEEIWSPDYDTPGFRADLAGWFATLGCAWVWQPVSIRTATRVIADIGLAAKSKNVVVMNLCDGTEADGYPGSSVCKLLEKHNIPYSGADTFFYEITTSKPRMKTLFRDHNVPTAPFVEISDSALSSDVSEAVDHVGFPFIVKPSVSCASQGIQEKSVCWDRESALVQIPKIRAMKGIGDGGVFVEKFIIGREFTALVIGNISNSPEDICVYPVVERAFHAAIPLNDRYLTFEKYWDVPNPTETKLSTLVPHGTRMYYYKQPEEAIQPILQDVARRAFISLNGTGYARVDMRMCAREDGSPERGPDGAPLVYVLEVNSQCGLSTDDETSVSWVLKLSGSSMADFAAHIITTGIRKQQLKAAVDART